MRRSAATAIAQSSLPFTAATVALKLSQMTINELSSAPIPSSEIYEARKSGLDQLTTLADQYNAVRTLIRVNQEEPHPPLVLNWTNISRTIERVAKEAVAQKIIVTRNAKYVSFFLDESTTKMMQSRPVYCGLMVITEAFDWAMFFSGQIDTAGSESGETYTKQVLAALKPQLKMT